MSKYIILENISKGTYGETYKVEYNDVYFCKKVYITDDYQYGLTDDFIREVLLLNENSTSLNIHDLCIKAEKNDDIYIIIDYYLYTLSDFIQNTNFTAKHLSYAQISNILPSLLYQLYNVHKIGFIHSDLKLDNILEKKGNICICDWGLTEYYGYPKQIKKYQCSRYFKAPDQRISISVDLYSLGACIFYLLTGISGRYKNVLTLHDIEKKEFYLKRYLNTNEYNILKNLISNENNRLSAKKILINNYNFIPIYVHNNFEQIVKLFGNIQSNIVSDFYLYDYVFEFNENFYRVKIERYTYNDLLYSKKFEIEYLDDTFTHFYNTKIKYNIKYEFNKMSLMKFLKYYYLTCFSLQTLLLSIHIFNLIPEKINLDKYKLSDIIKIIINYSSKLIEDTTFNFKLNNMQLCEIIDIDIIILNMFQNKEVEFLPYTFYIYYYLTKIIQQYSEYYRNELKNLESIVLSIFFITFIDLSYLTDITLHNLSINIVIDSIYFLKNSKFDNDNIITKSIFDNFKLIPNLYINKIIVDSNLRTYLCNSLIK